MDLMYIFLLGSIIGTLVLTFFLYKVGINKRYIFFAGFVIFGLIAGTLSGLDRVYCCTCIYNLLGMYLGDGVYTFAINHFGDPHSFQAHYTIPWALQTPQVYIYSSLVSYSLLGLIIQIVYNKIRKPVAVPQPRIVLLAVIAFIICIGVSTGVVYAVQSVQEGPTGPHAYAVREPGINGSEVCELTEVCEWNVAWLSVTPWENENQTGGDSVFDTNTTILVNAVIESTSSESGIAEVNLKVEGDILSTQRVTLLSYQNASVKFILLIPEEGVYVLSIGDSSQGTRTISVIESISK